MTPDTPSHNPLAKLDLSPQQLAAIPLLLQGLGDTQVGLQVGVDRVTIYRWRNDPRFSQVLHEQSELLFTQRTVRVQGILDRVLDIIEKQLDGSDARTALRAAAVLSRIPMPRRFEEHAAPRPPAEKKRTWEQRMEAYINAPMPDEPGHKEAMQYAVGEDEEEDDAMDEESE